MTRIFTLLVLLAFTFLVSTAIFTSTAFRRLNHGGCSLKSVAYLYKQIERCVSYPALCTAGSVNGSQCKPHELTTMYSRYIVTVFSELDVMVLVHISSQ